MLPVKSPPSIVDLLSLATRFKDSVDFTALALAVSLAAAKSPLKSAAEPLKLDVPAPSALLAAPWLAAFTAPIRGNSEVLKSAATIVAFLRASGAA